MATTLTQIAAHLEQNQLQHEIDAENQRIITGFQSENVENFWIVISLSEEGEYLQLVAPQLLTNISDTHTPILFKALLHISSQTNMVRWAYDSMGKEISASIELPLLDNNLTAQQFELCLEALVRIVDEIAMPRLKEILETGVDPGEIELGERILLNLEETYPGSLPYVEQALLRRKNLAESAELSGKKDNAENFLSLTSLSLTKVWGKISADATYFKNNLLDTYQQLQAYIAQYTQHSQ
ncbi:hypothetical protein [Calothrix sp. UHCC 0171]|uniref:hypothetical protein n=1 Tax=Calothrix sp. UHCC 0171 TaxID=3110245 RepID=UPI002B1F917C|nr:hypothetical protein [Calothrix sp. UHCC 0171]MEA5573488.1 hypothetical protein [Calothrix sp. UHCC 0171]